MSSTASATMAGRRASSLARAVALLRSTRLGGVCLVVAVLCLWEASVRFAIIESTNWPAFTSVLAALFRGLASGELLGVIGSTLWRMARGYAIGCAIGLPLGLAVALVPAVRLTLEPTIELLRPVPVPAIIPPLIFVFGINDPLKLFAVAFAVLFPVALNTMSGVASVDPVYLQMARTFGVARMRTLAKVIFPAALPFILAGLRTSLALALVVTVVAEMIAGDSGIGYYLVTMQFAVRSADMYAAIILLAAVAYLLNWLFIAWEARVIGWARTRETQGMTP
jgi:ABC-type nitrate/sulfonate/bicarbonate transport system permease component